MSLVIVSQNNNFGLQISSNYVCFSRNPQIWKQFTFQINFLFTETNIIRGYLKTKVIILRDND